MLRGLGGAREGEREDVHAKFMSEMSALVERGVLVLIVEVVEGSELDVRMAHARFLVCGGWASHGGVRERDKEGEGEAVSDGFIVIVVINLHVHFSRLSSCHSSDSTQKTMSRESADSV